MTTKIGQVFFWVYMHCMYHSRYCVTCVNDDWNIYHRRWSKRCLLTRGDHTKNKKKHQQQQKKEIEKERKSKYIEDRCRIDFFSEKSQNLFNLENDWVKWQKFVKNKNSSRALASMNSLNRLKSAFTCYASNKVNYLLNFLGRHFK